MHLQAKFLVRKKYLPLETITRAGQKLFFLSILAQWLLAINLSISTGLF